MNNIYEEEIVKDACKVLEQTKGVKIKAINVEVKEVQNSNNLWDNGTMKIFITLMMGDSQQTISCNWDACHNPSKAIKLPLVDTLVERELMGKLKNRSFIVVCFAAWFYKLGKHYKYF